MEVSESRAQSGSKSCCFLGLDFLSAKGISRYASCLPFKETLQIIIFVGSVAGDNSIKSNASTTYPIPKISTSVPGGMMEV